MKMTMRRGRRCVRWQRNDRAILTKGSSMILTSTRDTSATSMDQNHSQLIVTETANESEKHETRADDSMANLHEPELEQQDQLHLVKEEHVVTIQNRWCLTHTHHK